jgi:hypothetical protein
MRPVREYAPVREHATAMPEKCNGPVPAEVIQA